MKRLFVLLIIALAAAVLSGCEPAPSTTLAPDKQPSDASKMSPEEIDKMLKQNAQGAERSR